MPPFPPRPAPKARAADLAVSSPTSVPDPFVAWAERLRASDPRALEELFRHLHEPLVGYALTLTPDRDGARDLVQEVFVKVWEARDRLDPSRSLRALLFRMLRNRALNLARDQANRLDLLNAHYEPPRPEPADAAFDGDQLREHLDRWMNELPERQREALRLSRFDGLSHDEIAEVMEISPRTVNNHLVKALRHLRNRLAVYAPHLLDAA